MGLKISEGAYRPDVYNTGLNRANLEGIKGLKGSKAEKVGPGKPEFLSAALDAMKEKGLS